VAKASYRSKPSARAKKLAAAPIISANSGRAVKVSLPAESWNRARSFPPVNAVAIAWSKPWAML
jgi:hypothetical protein